LGDTKYLKVTARSVEADAGRKTKFAPGKILQFFELFLEISLFEFRFTVFFTLGCGVD